MNLTAAQIYALARAAGFPAVVAVTMTAIALRESAGKSDAFNGNAKTGDRSYGLWQINMAGKLASTRLAAFGITDEKQLLDPATNAHAAFVLWARKNQNLSICWYIDRAGIYRDRYESHLAAAQAAALAGELT